MFHNFWKTNKKKFIRYMVLSFFAFLAVIIIVLIYGKFSCGDVTYYIDAKNFTDYMISEIVSDKTDGTLLFVGDIMPARGVRKKAEKINSYDFIFDKVRDEISSADIAVCNLESPLSRETADRENPYVFGADPVFAGALRRTGFTAAIIANNHALDMGLDGARFTIESLENEGIMSAGIVIKGSSKIKGDMETGKSFILALAGGKKIAIVPYTDVLNPSPFKNLNMVSVNLANEKKIENDMKAIGKISNVTVAVFHWGREYDRTPDYRQKMLAHAAVDSGASLVIGHHPHVIQEVEKYKGCFIFYSLGNFVFDQTGKESTRTGLVVRAYIHDGRIGFLKAKRIRLNNRLQPEIVE